MQPSSFIFGAALLTAVSFGTLCAAESPSAGRIDFNKDIQPILQEHCHECHGAEKQKAGLRLDLKNDALKGGESGGLLIAGDSAKSLLVQVVEGTHGEISRMPKKREPIPASQIQLLRRWIDQGAEWPDAGPLEDPRLKHWAFTPPVRPATPPIQNKRWAANPIDHFIHARLQREKLTPSREADKITLLRRLSLDLIGLPSTP